MKQISEAEERLQQALPEVSESNASKPN